MIPLVVDLETAWRGGQNQALLLLRGLLSRGHAAELLTATGSALGARAEASGICVHYVSRGMLRIPAARKIRELLRSGRIDLLHANEAHAVSAIWLAGGHRRVPFVISRRVGYSIRGSRIARARYAAATRILANSKWVAAQAAASGAPRERIAVVYEGAVIPPPFTPEQRDRARRRWGVASSAPLLGCVGVLLPDKGQEWLIRAVVELHRDYPEAKLLLAGDGPCRQRLEALARQIGISEVVIFAGFVKDVESVYAALDVFLLPSLFEALNNSLLAAMAHEIPSIAFNRGALGEIIEHGKCGLLVSGPDVAEICSAVKQILSAPDFAKTLARGGRLRVHDNFSVDRMVDGSIRVYEEALNRPAGPSVKG